MHICIIGTGASGWIVCTILKKLEFIKKITIIGSSKIPSIGVGESTTMTFAKDILGELELDKFVRETDAAVKYGVYYQNWGKRDFLHYFKSTPEIDRMNCQFLSWGEMLANKDADVHIHDLMGNKVWNFTKENKVSLNYEEHNHTWHFDAGKFITYLRKINLDDQKVSFVDDEIIDAKLNLSNIVEYIVGEKNKKYIADYYVNCCGDNKLNIEVFKEEYISLSPYLLTNKALVYPLKYSDKKNQFHPYTVAKTMKNGWRWITPTQSRIGTGYVFSDNHISVDQATHEFVEDIGDKTVEPFLVDFSPKYNKKPFKINSCTIGMSCGFLEPLDAPGLAATVCGVEVLKDLFSKLSIRKNDKLNLTKFSDFLNSVNNANYMFEMKYKLWCSFILQQYKTCWRTDTQFWKDHKNVKCEFYDEVIKSIEEGKFNCPEYFMFFHTTAGKDVQWKSRTTKKPSPVEQIDTETIHHLDYIKSFYD